MIEWFTSLSVIITFIKFISDLNIPRKAHYPMLLHVFVKFWGSWKLCITLRTGISFLFFFLFVVNFLMFPHIITPCKFFSAQWAWVGLFAGLKQWVENIKYTILMLNGNFTFLLLTWMRMCFSKSVFTINCRGQCGQFSVRIPSW